MRTGEGYRCRRPVKENKRIRYSHMLTYCRLTWLDGLIRSCEGECLAGSNGLKLSGSGLGMKKEWEKLAAVLDLCLELAPGKWQHAFHHGDWLRSSVSGGVALTSMCAHQQLRHTWVALISWGLIIFSDAANLWSSMCNWAYKDIKQLRTSTHLLTFRTI